MQRKKAGELLKQKVSKELNDEIFAFSKNLPMGMGDTLYGILAQLIPEVYYADRLSDIDWNVPEGMITTMTPLLMTYDIGATLITGYYDGESFRDMSHSKVPIPIAFKYINPPSK
jgi:hypothetical protein